MTGSLYVQSGSLGLVGVALGAAKKINSVDRFAVSISPCGRPPRDHRMMIEAMIYRLRVGCPWRDLPPFLGSWRGVYTRWRR